MALVRMRKAFSKYTTSPCPFRYDVFLSFRGEDTRKNFTDHLYTALVNAGVRTFRDDPELERGENIKEKLENAIRQSRSSVIVFSKDYTSSTWCLEELVMILQLKRTSDHVVLPIFYSIEPSDVRKQAENLEKKHRGVLAKAIARLKKKERAIARLKKKEQLSSWTEALREVADLAGMVLENEADRHESKFIQKIVREIKDKLGRASLIDIIRRELEDKSLSVRIPILSLPQASSGLSVTLNLNLDGPLNLKAQITTTHQ